MIIFTILNMSEGPGRELLSDGFVLDINRQAHTFGTALLGFSLLVSSRCDTSRVFTHLLRKHTHGLLEVLLLELALLIDNHVDAFPSSRKQVVLKRCRAEVSVYNVTGLVVRFTDPLGELHRVGYCGGEEDVADRVREKNKGFFPNDTSFYVIHTVKSVGMNLKVIFSSRGYLYRACNESHRI